MGVLEPAHRAPRPGGAFRDALSRSCSNFSSLHSSPVAPPCAAAFAACRLALVHAACSRRLFTP
eukprot:147207-Prymnesium_polylepis.1